MPITSPCVSISGPPELPRLIAASVWMASSMNAVWLVCTVRDRKSTRLNSSHGYISYVVFCLKKTRLPPRQAKEPQPRSIIEQDRARCRRAFPHLAGRGGGVNSISSATRFAARTKYSRTPALRRHRQPHRGGRGGGAAGERGQGTRGERARCRRDAHRDRDRWRRPPADPRQR